MTGGHPLDNPTRSALLGPHAALGVWAGDVVRYPIDVSPFAALPDEPDAQAWLDFESMCQSGSMPVVAGLTAPPPATLEVVFDIPGVQMTGEAVRAERDSDVVELGEPDVPEMLDLVKRTQPGPFLTRTIVLGIYLGIRRDGQLVAMAGERMHPPGWTEISAVCSDPAYRGQGLASLLMRAVAAGVLARGETPFLHAAGSNVNAIRLYQALGFSVRTETTFRAFALRRS